jgi:hypothetical protein
MFSLFFVGHVKPCTFVLNFLVSPVLANEFSRPSQQFFSLFSASPVRSSLTPPFFLYTKSKGEDGKYLKKVSKGDLPVEVWTTLL